MVLLVCLLFLFSFTPLFSSTLKWNWSTTDERIKYYRYRQSNLDEWTVIDSTITSVTTGKVNNLFLEASYDGILWSETSIGTYTTLKEEEKTEDIGYVLVSWSKSDDYSYIRYERDSESEDGWRVIDGSSESIVLPYHKGVNTYYIQSSWDGVNWSESAYCTYIADEEKKTCACNTILWTWDTDDSRVKYFRYKLDNNEWTVVDAYVREIELEAHDGLNTLFVEASYDKEAWSESASGRYTYESKTYRTRRWETALSLLPYSYQRIDYTTEHNPESRASIYGGGLGLELRYNFNSIVSLGSGVRTEHYKYEDFHIYHDLKLTSTLGLKLSGKNNSRNKLSLLIGGGVDFVVRDDGEVGFYPLIEYGVRDTFRLNEKLSLGFTLSLNHTFQNGSVVMHVLPSISLTYTWGCKAGGCTGCKGGCR